MTEPNGPRDRYIGRPRRRWINGANIFALIIIILIVATLCSVISCRGKESIDLQADAGSVFLDARDCAAKQSGDSAVARETLEHLVNGGIHDVDVDSLHRILGNDQPAEAVTHTYIDTVRRDTTVTIYLRAPLRDILEHELANAFVARHRVALLGSDTAKAQTSAYYKACVRYCPKCTGAY